MDVKDLPGYEESKKLGYILVSSAADRSSADYYKEGITLTIRYTSSKGGVLAAELFASPRGILRLEAGPFDFPNKNFEIFERDMIFVLKSVLRG